MFIGITRFTGIISHAGVLVTAIVLLSGAAVLRGGAASADSNEDDHFLALLDQEGIPALEGVPSLVDTAHKVCRALNAGIPADRVVKAMVDYAETNDPPERLFAPGRLARTEGRFITAAVGAYCPYDRSKIALIVTDPASRWTDPAHRSADDLRSAVNSRDELREPHFWPADALAVGHSGGYRPVHGAALTSQIGPLPAGEVTQPDPPQVPAPPPPVAHLQTPPRPIAAPPRPQLVLPRPQQPPPPPAVAPQPGAAPGNGDGGVGGGLPAEPAPAPPEAPPPAPPAPPEASPPAPPAPPVPPPASPAPPMAPGFVRLAP